MKEEENSTITDEQLDAMIKNLTEKDCLIYLISFFDLLRPKLIDFAIFL